MWQQPGHPRNQSVIPFWSCTKRLNEAKRLNARAHRQLRYYVCHMDAAHRQLTGSSGIMCVTWIQLTGSSQAAQVLCVSHGCSSQAAHRQLRCCVCHMDTTHDLCIPAWCTERCFRWDSMPSCFVPAQIRNRYLCIMRINNNSSLDLCIEWCTVTISISGTVAMSMW